MTTEEEAKIMHDRMTPTADELARSAREAPPGTETASETFNEVVAHFEPAVEIPNVITFKTDLLGGNMALKDSILSIFGLIFNLAPTLLGIFAAKSSVTPIVGALAPFIPKVMESAQVILSDQPGDVKAKAGIMALGTLVDAGVIVSAGGQKHTMEEFKVALPAIQETFTEIVNAVKVTAAPVDTMTQGAA
jgi:hypothetical protein